MTKTSIEAHDLTYEYSADFGVHDIDLHVPRGTITAVRGTSGAGKSTLLALLGLILHPTSGELALDGHDTRDMSPNERDSFRRDNIGIILQDLALLPFLNAWENVSSAFGPRLGKNREKARNMLSEVGLGDRCETPAGNLSGGERQRVAVARAQVKDPSLVLADEPTGSLDPDNSEAVMRLLRRLADNDTSVLIATHSAEVASSCDAEIHLDQGNIVASPRQGLSEQEEN